MKNVLGLPELLENIMLLMDPKDLLKHLQHDVAFGVRAQVNASVKLQRKLFQRQEPGDPIMTDDEWELTEWKPNRILFQEKNDNSGLHTFFSVGSSHYAMGVDRDDFICFGEERMNDKDLPEKYRRIFGRKDVFSFLLYTMSDEIPQIQPEMLDMYLTDKAEPFFISLCQCHEGWEGPHLSTKLWVPPGKTLREILHWVTAWKAGVLQVDDVFNGFYQWERIEEDTMDWVLSGQCTEEEYREEFENGPLVRHGIRKVPRVVRTALQKREAETKALEETQNKLKHAEEKWKQAEKKLKEK